MARDGKQIIEDPMRYVPQHPHGLARLYPTPGWVKM